MILQPRSLLAKAVVSCLLGLACCQLAGAQDFSQLQGEFWVEKQPMGPQGPLPRLQRDESVRLALDEMSYVFSGIIHGYRFVYTPLDIAREVKERFELQPLGSIARGDDDLEYRESHSDEAFVRYRFRYVLDEHEVARREAQASAAIPNASGQGSASFYQGPAAKIEAIKAAIREAIRAFARPRMQNKPAFLTGTVFLADIPPVQVEHGEYRARATVKIVLEEQGDYRTW